MDSEDFIRQRVHSYYWDEDINCATTCLRILAEKFSVVLEPQVLSAALGMHGAGKYGAQCGLVEGTLMFIGIIGKRLGLSDDDIVDSCREFAAGFEEHFGSLVCAVLRPAGFSEENEPHLCEGITCRAISHSIGFISGVIRSREINALVQEQRQAGE
ncbi:MAG TPA: C-GCAxxG-C-C family protein [Deltaproteobacteria bacterium]|nr:C-GCAxxG-C-C family protein [Deltaproteobacteria bacterium]HPR51809.1 C-GCAxxG-C-C family protein [Deltaproteobacteria bacterium]